MLIDQRDDKLREGENFWIGMLLTNQGGLIIIIINGLLKTNHLAARRLNYMIFTITILY